MKTTPIVVKKSTGKEVAISSSLFLSPIVVGDGPFLKRLKRTMAPANVEKMGIPEKDSKVFVGMAIHYLKCHGATRNNWFQLLLLSGQPQEEKAVQFLEEMAVLEEALSDIMEDLKSTKSMEVRLKAAHSKAKKVWSNGKPKGILTLAFINGMADSIAFQAKEIKRFAKDAFSDR